MSASTLTDLVTRFLQLNLTKDDERMQINANTLLDAIISCLHSSWRKEAASHNEVMISFIKFGSLHFQEENLLMKSKFCQAASYMISINKATPTSDVADSLVTLMSSSLERTNAPSIAQTDIYKALLVVLENWMSFTTDSIFACQEKLWTAVQSNMTNRGSALQCLTCVIPRLFEMSNYDKDVQGETFQRALECLTVLIDNYQETVEFYKVLTQALKFLLVVFSCVKHADGLLDATYIVTLLKVFLVFGLPGFLGKFEELKKNLPEIKQGGATDVQHISRKERAILPRKMVNKRKSKKAASHRETNPEPNANRGIEHGDALNASIDPSKLMGWLSVNTMLSSESELSDSDLGHLDKIRSSASHIRQNALRCLQALLKCCARKVKFSCWPLLIPESFLNDDVSLLHSLMNDPNFKVRQNALVCIMELVDGSQAFLDAAVMGASESIRAFTTFSSKLSQSLLQLHETLIEALSREVSDAGLEKVIRCLMLVVLNSPYNKMEDNVVLRIIPCLGKQLASKDTNLLVSTLTCIAAVISVRPGQETLADTLDMSSCPDCIRSILSDDATTAKFSTTWIVRLCCHHITSLVPDDGQDKQNIAVECLQVLGVITKYYPKLIRCSSKLIVTLLYEKCFNLKQPGVAYFGVKLFEEFGRYHDGLCSTSEDHIATAADYWQDVFAGSLLSYSMDYSCNRPAKVKAAVCDCLSTIGTHVFGVLPLHQQICCKTSLIGLANDDDNFIKSAAIRSLGILILYPSIADDPGFFTDVVRLCLEHMKSTSISVRSKVSWSLGNVCNALIKNRLLPGFCDLPRELFLQLLTTSSAAAKDHDKVKLNGVRAIGLLLQSLPSHLMDDPLFSGGIDVSIRALLPNLGSGPMKGRWNACYALANAFHNDYIPLGSASWTDDCLIALVKAMQECKNFKVRISAVVALATPRHRRYYGNTALFYRLWEGILTALEASKELANFTEFKYKENLQNQLVELLLHLIGCLLPEDAASLDRLDDEHVNCMLEHVGQYKAKCIDAEQTAGEQEEQTPADNSSSNIAISDAVSSMQVVLTASDRHLVVLAKLNKVLTQPKKRYDDYGVEIIEEGVETK